MKLKWFKELIKNLPDWVDIEIEGLYSGDGLNYYVESNFEEINDLKDQVESYSDKIEELEKEKEELEKQKEALEEKVESINGYFNKLTNERGETFKELFDRNEWQAKEIEKYEKTHIEWRKNHLDLTKKIEKLQARKNKATITERDPKTGQLIAEYQGVKYLLTKL